MCGIIGLFIKNPELESQLGELVAPMLVQMSERGPDSAGIAVYRDPVDEGSAKLTVVSDDPDYDWAGVTAKLQQTFGQQAACRPWVNHAVLTASATAHELQRWLGAKYPELRITSSGTTIEIYKEKGAPREFIDRFQLQELSGSHAVCHTRMATESAVTTEHSHPFSTGLDLCLVHNGSLSNHNRLRAMLQRQGVAFQTDNDSEVAAGYLMWRLREGATLEEALEAALRDLDGFYTFAIGTREGFAMLRDPFGCKPAILAETDDWAAMSSEFRAIATLPGVEDAKIWEPVPEQIYSWSRPR
ncbi:MAG: glutamine amidotransferase [Candidatus Entotheonella factor]|uniref:Glutamine amidotransferase n=1 Tax=Entotheonella factor TaxID=1429438 RepID=W4L4S9_ENTF1|nr:MAG: glutamine amidotransferase [Candidatus Entotheonella factor]